MHKKHQVARERLLSELIREKELPYEIITGKLHISRPTVDYFVDNKIVKIVSENVYRTPVKAMNS